ncbi:nucleotide sugar dehydrogenase [uncultured Bradyrhizobium sp.]|uniref:nucleotide sugar dehydrogenase n=1 Tax=uncultured Bradyrhizobium sp. TaxID=199684 RepID=UPI0035CC3617
MPHVVVIGAGYVGLPTAIWLNEIGHQVTLVETAPERLDMLRCQQAPFSCPELSSRLQAADMERLRFQSCLEDCQTTDDVEAVILAVPADSRYDGSIDISILTNVIKSLVTWPPARNAFICVRSTVMVGDSAQMIAAVDHASLLNRYVYWPAFLRQHRAFEDLARPDRIVVGCQSAQTATRFANQVFPENLHDLVLVMSCREAELTKQMSNSVLAVNQVLTAELSLVCEHHAVNAEIVRRGIAGDFRIGMDLLEHHPGLGDLCLRKDLSALCKITGETGTLLDSAAYRSDEFRRVAIGNIVRHVRRIGRSPTVAVVGLGYASQVGDVRGALSPQLLSALQGSTAIRVWDAYADVSSVIATMPGVEGFESLAACLADADVAVLLVDHPELREVNWEAQVGLMKDVRSIFDFARVTPAGISDRLHNWYTAGSCPLCLSDGE